MNERSGDVLISIIIATYDAGQHLRECLQSITSQAVKALEIIVVDGGSKDETISILKDATLPMLTWTSEPDKGIYDALNKGIGMARGKWIYFLGADDRLLPGFSELAAHLKDDHTVYYGNSKAYYGDAPGTLELLQGSFSNYRLAKHCMNHQSILYPATVFQKYTYNLRYKVLADYALNILLWGDNSFKKIHYPLTVVRYHMGGFSSAVKDQAFREDKLQLIRKGMGWRTYMRLRFKRLKVKLKLGKEFWES
ncbi:glycosyltransferase involved in cell wall biosynthesis [Chitinophaga niastensis]|uniref:Glycosyltransferase involved in cell wall biosynthesis n=1 Tax=Chitinophaga niastensis TaxID=536980 RepID=A0A2P8HQ19_CHINA|nr:glycosyltransferase family 2 protein [Chitinophaga niastensis]PSL48333.1 glycosyltransferase involved in cell wall biosynthesis [Chitinophaga niastensis]